MTYYVGNSLLLVDVIPRVHIGLVSKTCRIKESQDLDRFTPKPRRFFNKSGRTSPWCQELKLLGGDSSEKPCQQVLGQVSTPLTSANFVLDVESKRMTSVYFSLAISPKLLGFKLLCLPILKI